VTINHAKAASQMDKKDATTFSIGKRWFYSVASYPFDYISDVDFSNELLLSLARKGVDLFTFVHRTFLFESANVVYPFRREFENIAILQINSYDEWWKKTIKKRERQSVNKSIKVGVEVKETEVNYDFLKGVQRIYNETPFREGRRYSGYGQSIEVLKKKFEDIGDSDIIGAYLNRQLIGLLWVTYGDRAAMFRSFVSLLEHRDKCPNNALISEAVRRCDKRHFQFLVYGNKYGFLPSLDRFREHQGFQKFPLPRYYVPLTTAGQLAIKLGVHRKIEYMLPMTIERALLKIYNYSSHLIPPGIWYKLGEE
jgi:hypothetical protein